MLYPVFQPTLELWILTTLWRSYGSSTLQIKKWCSERWTLPSCIGHLLLLMLINNSPSHIFFPNKSIPIFHWWGAHHPLLCGLKLEIQERACDSGSGRPVSCPVNASYSPGFSYWHRNACIRLKTSVQIVGLTELSFPLSLDGGEVRIETTGLHQITTWRLRMKLIGRRKELGCRDWVLVTLCTFSSHTWKLYYSGNFSHMRTTFFFSQYLCGLSLCILSPTTEIILTDT